jgi:NADH dehydrogenase
MDKARRVDLPGKVVYCEHHTLPFDYLIVAVGGVTSYFNHPQWEKHAPGLKTLDDALLIRRNVLLAFEQAENERDPVRQQELVTIVVVGGGPTGVEIAGACAELAYRVLRKDFDRLDPRRTRIILIEASSCILSHLPTDLSEKAQRQLQLLGVEVRNNCKVAEIGNECVVLDNGQAIRAANVIWAAGVMAHPLTRTLGVELDRAGRIKVNADLSFPGYPNVFAVGDVASVARQDGKPVPGVAPAAMQMARYVRRLIEARLDNDASEVAAFRYRDKGTLATIGRSAGVAQFGKTHLTGFAAWAAWLLVHLVFLIGFRNRLSVLISWAYSYLTYRLGARIITGAPDRQDLEIGVSASDEAPKEQVLNAG